MSDKTSRRDKLLAGMAGSTLALGLAVAVGAVPGPGVAAPVTTQISSQLGQLGAAPVLPVEPAPVAAPEVPAAAVAPVAAPVAAPPKASTAKAPAPAAAPRTAGTRAPARPVAAAAPASAAAAVPAPAAAVVASVPRRTPSATEIKETIAELRSRVGGVLRFVSPTAAQLNQAGDQVCTGFDNGQSFAQVQATGLSSIPSTVQVSPEDADWAVRKLVTLYCPGHAGKLT